MKWLVFGGRICRGFLGIGGILVRLTLWLWRFGRVFLGGVLGVGSLFSRYFWFRDMGLLGSGGLSFSSF